MAPGTGGFANSHFGDFDGFRIDFCGECFVDIHGDIFAGRILGPEFFMLIQEFVVEPGQESHPVLS